MIYTINAQRAWGYLMLKSSSSTAALDTRLLLQHALKCSTEYLIVHDDFIMNHEQTAVFKFLINERLQGKPVSKIIGNKEFYGLSFLTNPHVLDPRPDSEVLIDAVKKYLVDLHASYNFLELGVGSGCLMITLLKLYKHAQGTGCDYSESALEITNLNRAQFQLTSRLTLLKSHWFNEIRGKYDIIISNPPYIRSIDIDNLSIEVKNFDPHLALDGGQDGLKCYRELAPDFHRYLNPNGWIFLEIGEGQAMQITELMQQHSLEHIEWICDLSGIQRCGVFKLAEACAK